MCWNGLQMGAFEDCDDLSAGGADCFGREFIKVSLQDTPGFFEVRLGCTMEFLLFRLCVIFFL